MRAEAGRPTGAREKGNNFVNCLSHGPGSKSSIALGNYKQQKLDPVNFEKLLFVARDKWYFFFMNVGLES